MKRPGASRVLMLVLCAMTVALSLAYVALHRSIIGLAVIQFSAPGLLSPHLLAYNLRRGSDLLKRETLALLQIRADYRWNREAVALLESENRDVWLGAAAYLGNGGRQEAIPHLIKALLYDSIGLRADLARLLERLTGMNHGEDFSAWHDWWISQHGGSFDFFTDSPLPGGIFFRVMGYGRYELNTALEAAAEPTTNDLRLLEQTDSLPASTGALFGAHFVYYASSPAETQRLFTARFVPETRFAGGVEPTSSVFEATNGEPIWVGFSPDTEHDIAVYRTTRMEVWSGDVLMTSLTFRLVGDP